MVVEVFVRFGTNKIPLVYKDKSVGTLISIIYLAVMEILTIEPNLDGQTYRHSLTTFLL